METCKEVIEGMLNKDTDKVISKEAANLDKYVPTLDEFNSYIKTLNPN